MTTINISMPDGLYRDVKKAVKVRNYTSISEFIRDAVRKHLLRMWPEKVEYSKKSKVV